MKRLQRLAELLNTITEDSQRAVIAKFTELGFDVNRGEIPLDEAFANLNQSKEILEAAQKEGVLSNLPLSVQESLVTPLETISRIQGEALQGIDHVTNFCAAVEQLFAVIWQYGLRNVKSEVFDYEAKINRIKAYELHLARASNSADLVLAKSQDLQRLADEASKVLGHITEKHENASQGLERIADIESTVSKISSKLSELLGLAVDEQGKVAAILQSVKETAEALSKHQTTILDFVSEVGTARQGIETIKERAELAASELQRASEDTLKEHKSQTDALIIELGKLESQIKLAIEKATGYSLFHSFQKRQESVSTGKWWWLLGLAVVTAGAVWLGYSIATTVIATSWDVSVTLKILTAIPLAFAIYFTATQYSRERRLEEEYAFKSNISLSLVPYKDLVAGLATDNKEEFAKFIISSIDKVFTSPTDAAFRAQPGGQLVDRKAIESVKQIIDLVRSATGGRDSK